MAPGRESYEEIRWFTAGARILARGARDARIQPGRPQEAPGRLNLVQEAPGGQHPAQGAPGERKSAYPQRLGAPGRANPQI